MFKETLYKAINSGADELVRFFSRDFLISNKAGLNNLVTEADHASEKSILNTIQQQFPDHFILSEETGALIQDSAYKWIIDPIDGTVNFANGIPICCVSIGLEKSGEMIMGGVYNPFLKEFFFAEKKQGATLNDTPIKVSDKSDLLKSCMATGFPYTYADMPNSPMEVLEKLVRKGIPVRRLGSAAIDLCWVAAGRFDGYFEHKVEAWDSAAGYLIVEEAGGKVTHFNGDDYSPYQPQIVATNGKIHSSLLAILNGAML